MMLADELSSFVREVVCERLFSFAALIRACASIDFFSVIENDPF
jgi:hypothetical protein